jgi:signal transduction histidine kinase
MRGRLMLEEDDRRWALWASAAQDGPRWRRAFRSYLEAHGDPGSDFDAAELLFGELVGNCVRHAPGAIRVEFTWSDITLAVTDACERLRMWPFSPGDAATETTHHTYAILSALGGRVHLTREPDGGTRVSVPLPVAPDARRAVTTRS